MEKTYYEVGEVFQLGLIQAKCIEGDGCEGCIFNNRTGDCETSNGIVGRCSRTQRLDNKNVLFIKVDEKEV